MLAGIEPSKFGVTTVGLCALAIIALLLTWNMTASATGQSRSSGVLTEAILKMNARMDRQDERANQQDVRLNKMEPVIYSMAQDVKVIAKSSEWWSRWIAAGGEKK